MRIFNLSLICLQLIFIFKSTTQVNHKNIRNRHTLNGRYTKSIQDYQLVVPKKLSLDGEFQSFKLPHFFKHESGVVSRKKRSSDDPELINYGVRLNGEDHHIELWPNRRFLDPNMVLENRDPTAKVNDRKLRTLVDKDICHYTGRVKGLPNSRAALSTCDGLSGYITVGTQKYFIEPVDEHQANSHGHHLHLMYNKKPNWSKSSNKCGTNNNWEEAWKDRFRDQLTRHSAPIKKRGTESVSRYLKTAVVCDKKFMDFHKNRDMDTYVMTVMNMASDFYHDSSSGHMMDIVVVRIIYLEKEEKEIELKINQDAEKTLKSFCDWQTGINPKDQSNPNHHDIAVLLTRWDICGPDGNCGMTGLAYVAAACTEKKNCGINEDMGLVLGIVVAHEMGHVMGANHDKEGESTCPPQDTDESYFIMAPFVNLYTYKWSTCSRAFFTALFENDLGECLNDEPGNAIHKFSNALPGSVYDGDAQCDILFPNSKICLMDEGEFCDALLCRSNPDSCMSDGQPPADGTKCGTNQWCFHKKCVNMGKRPEAVAGGWGPWGDWTPCSRTCGGGVTYSSRECDNPTPQNRGRYCIGERKKIKLCNPNPCPPGNPNYRETQCTEKDKDPINGVYYKWKPYYKKEEPCTLYCVNDKRMLAKLANFVKDGTPCKAGSKSKCIFGVCKKIGCDNQIDSDAVEDICGICNGDGTQCKIIDELYKDSGAIDYKKVATIPARSRNIHIEEQAPSENTIALADKSEKHFYLNGNHKEVRDGIIKIGEVEAVYSHPEPGRETVIIAGPIKEDLIFFVCFYKPENVGYRYKYAEASTDLNYTPHYHWDLLEWTDCTAKCGGGTQTSKYDCIEDKVGQVSASFCLGEEKPETKTKKCNEKPCQTKWRVGRWGSCHACKGKSGVRMRSVECIEESPMTGADDALVEDTRCEGVKPASKELCNAHKRCVRRSGGIPDSQLRSVWDQIHQSSPKRQIDIESLMDVLNNKSTNCHQNTSNITLNVGKLVIDKVPDDNIKLIEVPFKQNNEALNLTDTAFESVGDSMSDNLDTARAKIVTGKGAAKLLKEMRENNTKIEEEHEKKKEKG